MSRRLLLISSSTVHGSGYLDHCMNAMHRMLAGGNRLTFVPFALHNHTAYAETVRKRFRQEGVTVESLHEAADPQAALAAAQAVFVGGGNTFRLLHTLYERDLVATLQKRVAEGMRYMGTSAGSNLACPTIRTTNDMPIVQPPSFTALDLVPFQLNPHYLDPDPSSTHKGESRETRIREYHEMNERVVIGLREGGMLDIDDDRMSLQGTAGARIFARDALPRECEPGTDLSDLLA